MDRLSVPLRMDRLAVPRVPAWGLGAPRAIGGSGHPRNGNAHASAAASFRSFRSAEPGSWAVRGRQGGSRASLARGGRPLAASSAGAGAGGAGAEARGKQKRKGKGKKGGEDNPYSETVLLPQTSFGMRANAVVREPELQKWWREERVYERLVEANSEGESFTLHDGPPYANGDLHLGHALNKILKDIIVKYHCVQGRRAAFVPGWDCHGLPIELKVLQSMSKTERQALTTATMRARAADFALEAVRRQAEQFQRYGVWADWQQPYVTLDPTYEAAQLQVFGKMFMQGHIYRGLKPVHWSPSSRTALAEAELEYPEGHTSRSVYLAFELNGKSQALSEALQPLGAPLCDAPVAAAVWTTTPWTIPANLAVAVNAEIDYAACEVQGDAGLLLVAEDLVQAVSAKLGKELKAVAVVKGSSLEGCTYLHPLAGRQSEVIVGGDYITTESGTGLVHTAPGHGQEDYMVAQRVGLPVLSPVDDAGRFTSEAGETFQGMSVLGDGNQAVIDALGEAGCLLLEEQYAHKYPYDWRTKKPTIFRATEQWFASVENFRGKALEAIGQVTWLPAAGEKRITAMTRDRNDWCISRQRKWGVPIPVFYDKETGEPLITEETLAHVTALVAKEGSGAWFDLPVEQLLPEGMRDQAPRLRKGEDTMDVWFDSGSSWAGVVQSREELGFPADLYLEGSDQHRGWFQSSLLTSVAVNETAPYRAVLTHGFVLDEKGAKMSKSLGNVIDPKLIIEGGGNQKQDPAYGADTMRLWVSSVDYSSDVLMGRGILKQTSEVYRKLRGTLRFLLGNVHDFDLERDAVPLEELPLLDKYCLDLLGNVTAEMERAYDSYQFSKVFTALQRFVVADLSNFYLDIGKDRLYVRAASSFERRSCQTVLVRVLSSLLPLVAPILPHLAEDAFQAIEEGTLAPGTKADSVFLHRPSGMSGESGAGPSEAELAAVRLVRELRGEVNRAIEAARVDKVVGSSLEAKVTIRVPEGAPVGFLEAFDGQRGNGVDELRYLFICSQVEVAKGGAEEQDGEGGVFELGNGLRGTVSVGRAEGSKCARCWNYSTQVGRISKEHPSICERCLPIVEEAKVKAVPMTTAP